MYYTFVIRRRKLEELGGNWRKLEELGGKEETGGKEELGGALYD